MRNVLYISQTIPIQSDFSFLMFTILACSSWNVTVCSKWSTSEMLQ